MKIPTATAAATTCGTAMWPRPFFSPIHRETHYYREFEVSPNGMWIDLDIFPGGLADLKSGLKKSVFLDEKGLRWAAELAIPIKALTPNFDPKAVWRANFYRIEGKQGTANLHGLAGHGHAAAEFPCAVCFRLAAL